MKTISTILLLFLCSIVMGQKIDLDKKKVTMQFMDPPALSDLNSFNTYSVDFIAEQTTLNQLGVHPAFIEKIFKLEGYVYQAGNAELVYALYIDPPKILREEVLTITKEVKAADGKMQKVDEFVAVCYFAAPTAIQLMSPITGDAYYSEFLSTEANPTKFESGAFPTIDGAQRVLRMKEGGLVMNARDLYIKQLTALVDKLKYNYDYRTGTYTQDFFDVDVSKAPEMAKFHDELTLVTDVLLKATPDKPLYVAQTTLSPVLKSWSEEASKISSTDKNLVKTKFLYLYNLAVAQLWLELFDDALATCKLIKENDFKKGEAIEIENNVNAIKKVLNDRGVLSRHMSRPGLTSTSKYTYVKKPVQKVNPFTKFVQDTKQDNEAIKKSVLALNKQIKDDIAKLSLGDTIAPYNSNFSTMKLTVDGEFVEAKKWGMSSGNGRVSTNEYMGNQYEIGAYRKSAFLGLTEKEGEVAGVSINFYSNKYAKETMNAGVILNFLKTLPGNEITDISTNSPFDKVMLYENGTEKPLKEITWQQYGKDIAADFEIVFRTKSRDDIYSYMTMNGDKFQIKILESRPIIIKHSEKESSQGYVVKLLVPEVRVTRLFYGHYVPHYKNDFKTVKDLELFIILE